MALSLPLTAQPDYVLGALAAFAGAEVQWADAAAEPEYEGAKGAEAVRAALDAKAPAGPALPALPSKFDAKTPFVEVSAILDALDDFLAYRYVLQVWVG